MLKATMSLFPITSFLAALLSQSHRPKGQEETPNNSPGTCSLGSLDLQLTCHCSDFLWNVLVVKTTLEDPLNVTDTVTMDACPSLPSHR